MDSITLVAESASVGVARDFVRGLLGDRAIDPSVAVLLTSELVTNAVLHARTELTLRVAIESSVRVEVCDGLAVTEVFRQILKGAPTLQSDANMGGWGLVLVRELATRFGLDDGPVESGGKLVWFELDHGAGHHDTPCQMLKSETRPAGAS